MAVIEQLNPLIHPRKIQYCTAYPFTFTLKLINSSIFIYLIMCVIFERRSIDGDGLRESFVKISLTLWEDSKQLSVYDTANNYKVQQVMG